MTRMFNNFTQAYNHAERSFPSSTVHTPKWQGVDISKKPEMAMHEILHYDFRIDLEGIEDLQSYRENIKPNLPWADDHFLERVGGEPLNPGETWKSWPYGHSADRFRDACGQFNHNYMERMWPKRANQSPDGKLENVDHDTLPNRGVVRGYLGDTRDLVKLLVKDPLTRQAYLPIWFPEDTGDANEGRKPCSLGYHFIMRDNKLHVSYYIRSCDFIRHFRDDCYLTVRLLLWVLQEARKYNEAWREVVPGSYNMYISSLHMFRNDYLTLNKGASNV